MKKIGYSLIALFIVGVFASFVYSSNLKKAVEVMQTQEGEIRSPQAVGKSYARFASTTEAVICSGKCMLFDAIISSGAAGAYARVRDAATADGTGDMIANLVIDGNGRAALSQGSYAFPILTGNGISLDFSSIANREEALVIYQDMD